MGIGCAVLGGIGGPFPAGTAAQAQERESGDGRHLQTADAAGAGATAGTVLGPMTVEATYTVYGGGLALYESDATVTLDPGAGYEARLAVRPLGLAALFGGSRDTLETIGRLAADGATVDRAFVHRDFGDRAKTTLIDYADRPDVAVTDVPERGAHTAIDPPILAETVDPVTGLIDRLVSGLVLPTDAAAGGSDPAALAAVAEAACRGRISVFDGRIAVAVDLEPAGSGTLPRSRIAVYEGPTARCRATVEPLDGDFEDMEDFWEGPAEDRTVTLHLARPVPDGPVMPVRLEGTTDAGAYRVHLTALTVGEARRAGLAHMPRPASGEGG